MAQYRIHQFDSRDHVLTSHSLDCANDEEALTRFSSAPLRGHAMELWSGRRLVRRYSSAQSPRRGAGWMRWPRL
jgi:hypothetical protein